MSRHLTTRRAAALAVAGAVSVSAFLASPMAHADQGGDTWGGKKLFAAQGSADNDTWGGKKLFAPGAPSAAAADNDTWGGKKLFAPDRPSELIVKFRPSIASVAGTLKTLGAQSGTTLAAERTLGTGATLVSVTGSVSDALKKVQADPSVEYASVNGHVSAADLPGTPNDPRFGEQWDLTDAVGGINTPNAWRQATGKGAVVAVIDTGITKHPDLDANVLPGYDMITKPKVSGDGDGRDADPSDAGDWNADGECGGSLKHDSSWHGTHVAGTIAAIADNRTGVVGIAPSAKIVPVRVLGHCGGSDADVIDGITWASGGSVPGVPANANPAKVANLSLGGEESCSPAYQDAINGAIGRGMLLVTAAGNSHDDANKYAPGNCQGVLNTAATTKHGVKAWYSNAGTSVGISAPGGEKDSVGGDVGILSTMNSGKTTPGGPTYVQYVGTSMAAPHVAGVAALVAGLKPTMSPADIRSTLVATARPFPSSCPGCGSGILDASAAVAKVTGSTPDAGRDIMTNGGFENGAAGWTANPTSIITTGDAAEGTHFAKFNGLGRTNTGTLSTTVAIPSTSRATLGYKFKVSSDEMTETTVRDTLTVTVDGTVVDTHSNLDKMNGYLTASVDVSKFAGKTVTITFTGKEDSWKQTTFQVDAVTLRVL